MLYISLKAASPASNQQVKPAVSQRGFTLIELLIAVAVMAILAAIAMPSYQNSIRKARRMDARTALTTIAQLMERYNTQNNTYVGASLGTMGPPSVSGTIPFFTISENGAYVLSLGRPTANQFTVTAIATGDQTADLCTSFTLDQAGRRGPSGLAAQCW